jgi:hypothetical protein
MMEEGVDKESDGSAGRKPVESFGYAASGLSSI